MPTSNTRALADFEARIIRSRFARLLARSSPRSPSFAPSSITTTVGRRRWSSRPIRDAPPAVVSPLILALTSRHAGWVACRRSAARLTHPWLAARP